MKTRALVVPILALSLAASSCGKLTVGGDGGIDHPTGAADLVLRVEIGGGLLPPEYLLRAYPVFSLYGDGRIVTEGPQIAIYPGPAMPNLLQRTTTEEGIQDILKAAGEAGLLGPDAVYDYPCIVDAGTTTFTIHADGGTHVVSAYALFEGEQLCDGIDEEARAKLLEFQRKIGDPTRWLPGGSLGDEEPYLEEELRVYVRPFSAAPDQNLEQPAASWPLAVSPAAFGESFGGLPDTRCGVVSGADLDLLRQGALTANELTPWESGGESYLLTFHPLLPDQHSC